MNKLYYNAQITAIQNMDETENLPLTDTSIIQIMEVNMKNIKKMTLSAMFLALGLILPMITGHVPQIGNMLLPMHIPVLLCGMICGWQYGLAVGMITPLLRCLLVGMPPLYPNAVGMTFELAAYGAVIGIMYHRLNWRGLKRIYASLLTAMAAGRIVWGAARVIMLGLTNTPFSFQLFLSGAFLTAVPGIILQLILIPALMAALERTGFLSES